MNKKLIIGTLIVAFVLIAAIATVMSAAPVFAATSSTGSAADGIDPNGMNGDRDQTQDQLRDKDQLKDGSCGGRRCTTVDGQTNGTSIMNQEAVQLQEQQRSMFGSMDGVGSGEYEYHFSLMIQNRQV